MLKHRKIYYFFSGSLIAISILVLVVFRLPLGIDFTGGSLLEIGIEGSDVPLTPQTIEQALEGDQDLNLGDVRVQPAEQNFLIRFRDVTEEEHQKILALLRMKVGEAKSGEATLSSGEAAAPEKPAATIREIRFESVGPVIGRELKSKALLQIVLVVTLILVYIAYVFRRVSKFKEKSNLSWKLGVIAILALIHDVTITIGIYALFGKFFRAEVDNSFIAAIMLVFGYSVNDTIVIFDRIRENLMKRKLLQNLEEIINKSITETIVRSVNTGSTTLLVLFTIMLFGGSSIFYFALTLIIGIMLGTYSSIFVACPLLYDWERKR